MKTILRPTELINALGVLNKAEVARVRAAIKYKLSLSNTQRHQFAAFKQHPSVKYILGRSAFINSLQAVVDIISHL